MAIVRDLAGGGNVGFQDGRTVDRRLASPNRTQAGTPLGSLTPQYAGELVLDTLNTQMWQASMPVGAVAFTTSSWIPVARVV